MIASQNADEKARLRDEIEALDKKSDELISQVEALARKGAASLAQEAVDAQAQQMKDVVRELRGLVHDDRETDDKAQLRWPCLPPWPWPHD